MKTNFDVYKNFHPDTALVAPIKIHADVKKGE